MELIWRMTLLWCYIVLENTYKIYRAISWQTVFAQFCCVKTPMSIRRVVCSFRLCILRKAWSSIM